MPFSRKTKKRYGRRPGRRRRPWFAQKYSIGQLARKAWSGVKYIKGLVNSEMYKMDIGITSNTFYNDGSACSALTGVAQGDGDGARTGNSILVKSLQVKGVVTRTTSGDAVQTCRIVIVQDRQNVADSSNPGYTTVFASSYPQTMLNALTVGRFSILYDNIFTLDTAKCLSKFFNIYIPLNCHVRFNGAASTDIQRNGIYMFTISTQATTNQPVLSWTGRLSYHDN